MSIKVLKVFIILISNDTVQRNVIVQYDRYNTPAPLHYNISCGKFKIYRYTRAILMLICRQTLSCLSGKLVDLLVTSEVSGSGAGLCCAHGRDRFPS